jgi:Glycosyltransferase family 92
MKKFIFLVFLLIVNVCQANLYDLSICAIFKNEGLYLKEWIEYHRCIGVQHFYLFNNNSNDNYHTVLKPYIDQGIIELEYAPDLADFHLTQLNSYKMGLIKSRGVSTWVAFIDIDEFIMPTDDVNLASLLNSYNYAGVAVNWRCFGTSDIAKLDPNELMISQLVRCAPYHYYSNKFVKSIVRPELVMYFWGAHNPIYFPGWHAVDACMVPQNGSLSRTVKLDPIRINHYWTRDEYYYNHFKKARRLAWGYTEEIMTKDLNDLNSEYDATMLRYTLRLKKALGI